MKAFAIALILSPAFLFPLLTFTPGCQSHAGADDCPVLEAPSASLEAVDELARGAVELRAKVATVARDTADNTAAINARVDAVALAVDALLERVRGLERTIADTPPKLPIAAAPDAIDKPPAPAPEPPPLAKVLEVIVAESGCTPCDKWKVSDDRDRLEADGFDVRVSVDTEGGPVPRFKLYVGDKFARHSGYLTYARAKELEQAVAAQAAAQR